MKMSLKLENERASHSHFKIMISWHVEKDGNVFEPLNPYEEKWWFPNFEYQELLIPYFGTGFVELDEYGRTLYEGEELDRLEAKIKSNYEFFASRGAHWEVVRKGYWKLVGEDQDPTFIEKFEFERDLVLHIFDQVIKSIEAAKRIEGSLVFLGD